VTNCFIRNVDYAAVDCGAIRAIGRGHVILHNTLYNPGLLTADLGCTYCFDTDGFKGKAPDLGAYEFGGERWVSGHDWGEPPEVSYELRVTSYGLTVLRGRSWTRSRRK
jgi:hypothetical protein